MSLIKKRTKAIMVTFVVLISVLFCIAPYIYMKVLIPAGNVVASMDTLEFTLVRYIKQNDGNFPSCEEELVRKDFLRTRNQESIDGQYSNLLIQSWMDPNSWISFYGRDKLKVSYGLSIEDIYRRNGKLYDLSTNEQIFLIHGPYKIILDTEYEKTSNRLYKTMLKAKNIEIDD